MLKPNRARYVKAKTGPTYRGPGDQIRFLITSPESNGAVFFAEVLVPPGGGPPLHRHTREDESFYLQEGEVTLQIDGETIVASAGDFVQIPRGLAHSFRNTGMKDAKMLVVTTPGGIESFFAQCFDLATDLTEPPKPATPALMARMKEAADKHGIELLVPPLPRQADSRALAMPQ